MWAISALFVTATILVWLFLGHYTRRVHVTGSLVPQAGLLTVPSRNAGTITSIDITEGAFVHAGQALLTISGDRSSVSMGDTSKVITVQLRSEQSRLRSDIEDTEHLSNEQTNDLRMQQSMLRNQAQLINAQLGIEHQQVRDLSALLVRLKGLGIRGYVSAMDIQQQRTQELNAESQTKSLERQRSETEQHLKSVGDELRQLPLTTATKLNELYRQMAQNEQAIAQNEVELATVLRAPKDGVVSAILIKPGQAVTPGQSLISIVPQGSVLQAQLLVPSTAIGFVRDGMSVALHYQAFPYQKFGVQHGMVADISRSALTPVEVTAMLGQQVPSEPLYRVTVSLKMQQVMAYGKPQALRPGMQLDADMILDRRRMIDWIFEPVYGMTAQAGGGDSD